MQAAGQVDDSLYVWVAGDSVSIWDVNANENCASLFVSSLTLSHDTLTWVQMDTVGPIARCICNFDMRVSMTGLARGAYVARIFRDRRKEYHYPGDTLMYIGSVVFGVNASAGSFAARAMYQSECTHASAVDGNVALVPAALSLRNYPNPFNPKTIVHFHLPVDSKVKLGVYDVLGREVAVLLDERKTAGVYTVSFDGTGHSSGAYFCRVWTEPTGDGNAGRVSPSGGPTAMTTLMVLSR
jgi:hypothetical protein